MTPKKKRIRLFVILALVLTVLAILIAVWLVPYLKRHFVTVEIESESVVSGETVNFDGRKVLTVYFTRVGNTDFDEDVDAVSGASLLLNEKEEFMGNSQVIGLMVQNAVGGDLISINTKKKYPSAYSDTISVASEEMKQQELPELVNMPESIDEYDTVFLVYPLWWNTIPKAVEAFLKNYDFSGKTVMSIVTHGGSGVGKSLEDIRNACNGSISENSLKIYCDDIPYCRESITEWLKSVR